MAKPSKETAGKRFWGNFAEFTSDTDIAVAESARASVGGRQMPSWQLRTWVGTRGSGFRPYVFSDPVPTGKYWAIQNLCATHSDPNGFAITFRAIPPSFPIPTAGDALGFNNANWEVTLLNLAFFSAIRIGSGEGWNQQEDLGILPNVGLQQVATQGHPGSPMQADTSDNFYLLPSGWRLFCCVQNGTVGSGVNPITLKALFMEIDNGAETPFDF